LHVVAKHDLPESNLAYKIFIIDVNETLNFQNVIHWKCFINHFWIKSCCTWWPASEQCRDDSKTSNSLSLDGEANNLTTKQPLQCLEIPNHSKCAFHYGNIYHNLYNVLFHSALQFITIDFYRLSLNVYLFLLNSCMGEIIAISKIDL
jgi:hypothetical protein